MKLRWLILAVCSACGTEVATPTATPTTATEKVTANAPAVFAGHSGFELNPKFTAGLLQAARQYRRWTRVDERPNLAPELCRAPMPSDHGKAARVRISGAKTSPHGRKLYFLYAKNKYKYLRLTAASQVKVPVGQVVVKQAWHAVPARKAARANAKKLLLGRHLPAVRTVKDKHGRLLTTGKQADLYIIMKLAANTPGTDDGYVYGTVTPDGKRVTSAGRVERCMGCHDNAPHERLFGLKR